MSAAPPVALRALLDRRLSIADVGCRWGFAEAWERLGEDVRVVGFDPDEQECARLRSRYAAAGNIEIVAEALAAQAGPRSIHLASDPACSSLYPPDARLVGRVPELSCMAETGVVEVTVSTLDIWRSSSGWGPIDFVKLDVQGAELDVLEGGTETLSDVVVLELEVEFNPLYEGQPLFADVDRFLRSHGFSLWRLANLVHYTSIETPPHPAIADVHFCDSRPVRWQSPGGQLFWGHATFVATDVIERASGDWPRALRAGCLAAALELHDLALHAWVGACQAAPPELGTAISSAIAEYRQGVEEAQAP